MKKIIILEKITQVSYYLFLLFVLFFYIKTISILSKDNLDYTFTINDLKIKGVINISSKIIVFISVFSSSFIIYALYIFHKNMVSFRKKKFFTHKVIRNFHNIGICLIIYGFIQFFSYFLFYFYSTTRTTSIHFTFLNSFISGLLFLVLADVFKLAKEEKENNELTI